jgi:hypothetical protein
VAKSQYREKLVFDLGGLIHLSGVAGSGKTLLAVALASKAARNGKVLWINTDAKTAFVNQLKTNIVAAGGDKTAVSLLPVNSHEMAQDAVLNLPKTLDQDTVLVVVDPVTRVSDMSHREEVMWGRELFEEVLPTLAGLVIARALSVVIVSESRNFDNEPAAVHHRSISRWVDHDLLLERRYGTKTSIVCKIGSEGDVPIFQFSLNNEGIIEIQPCESDNSEEHRCSESQCSV